MQEYYRSIEGREKMSPRTGEIMEVLCMDGRFDESGKENSVFVRDGGSGILRDSEGVANVAKDYVLAAQKLQVKKIRFTSHDSCGAWGLSGKDVSEGKKYYSLLIEEIKKQLADNGLPVEVVQEHITEDEKDNQEGCGLADHHAELATYYANVPSFNAQAVAEGMPVGFVISREHFTPAYCQSNVAVAIKIAFGGHGKFADDFSAKRPFLLVAVADSEEKLFQAKHELEEAKMLGIEEYLLKGLEGAEKDRAQQEYLQKIKVTGFVVDNQI